MALMPATQLPLETTALIEKITDAAFKRTLLSMGVTEGQRLTILRKTIFSQSFYVRIDQNCLALRPRERTFLMVENKSGGDVN